MTTSDTNLELHVDEMALRELRKTIVENSCPFYTNGDVCGGNVVFEDNEPVGTCQSCGREIPLFLEM